MARYDHSDEESLRNNNNGSMSEDEWRRLVDDVGMLQVSEPWLMATWDTDSPLSLTTHHFFRPRFNTLGLIEDCWCRITEITHISFQNSHISLDDTGTSSLKLPTKAMGLLGVEPPTKRFPM